MNKARRRAGRLAVVLAIVTIGVVGTAQPAGADEGPLKVCFGSNSFNGVRFHPVTDPVFGMIAGTCVTLPIEDDD